MTSPQPSSSTITDRPDLLDSGAVSDWLRDRYMRNPRDADFEDLSREVLRTGPDGAITADPLRFGLVGETRGLLVTAESGAGKTTLIRRNLTRQPQIGVTDGKTPGRAFYIRVKPEATLKGLATKIAEDLGYPPISSGARTTEVWEAALNRLKLRGITIIWIDEAHHMLQPSREVKAVLRRFKALMQDEPNFVLILSGVPDLENLIRQDEETDGRLFRMRLSPIRTETERSSIRQYISRCCELVELEPPSDPYMVQRLEAATRGSFGRSLELTQFAITRALRRRDGLLRLDDFRRSYDWKRRTDGDGPFDEEDWPTLKQILETQGWSP